MVLFQDTAGLKRPERREAIKTLARPTYVGWIGVLRTTLQPSRVKEALQNRVCRSVLHTSFLGELQAIPLNIWPRRQESQDLERLRRYAHGSHFGIVLYERSLHRA